MEKTEHCSITLDENSMSIFSNKNKENDSWSYIPILVDARDINDVKTLTFTAIVDEGYYFNGWLYGSDMSDFDVNEASNPLTKCFNVPGSFFIKATVTTNPPYSS